MTNERRLVVTEPTGQPRSRTNASRNGARANFRFATTGAHLTYRSFIPFADIKTKLDEVGTVRGQVQPFNWYSFVHERGHENEETPYDHTHVAWDWPKRIDKSNPRLFDITLGSDHIHPHIQLFRDTDHKVKIFEDYHRKEPVELQQSETGPRGRESLLQQAIRAPSLAEGVNILGIEVDSVYALKLLRDDIPEKGPFTHLYPESHWTLTVNWSRCLYLWGGTGTGKTQWAVHQFTNPLLVCQRDCLKDFRADKHDGIVFDDMDFSNWDRTELIHLCDWDNERRIKCRYRDAVIPAQTKKIFTSNIPFDATFFLDRTIGAIRRRFDKIVHVSGPTYGNPEEALTSGTEEPLPPELLPMADTFIPPEPDHPFEFNIEPDPERELFLSQMHWPEDATPRSPTWLEQHPEYSQDT